MPPDFWILSFFGLLILALIAWGKWVESQPEDTNPKF